MVAGIGVTFLSVQTIMAVLHLSNVGNLAYSYFGVASGVAAVLVIGFM